MNPNQWSLSWPSKLPFVYFVQQSDNLSDWSWESFHLAEEDVLMEESINSDSNRVFFRLQYTEFSANNTSLLLADDFDADSLSNYDEISTYSVMGLDPLKLDSDGNEDADGDGDGQNNADEFAQGRLPNVVDADVKIYADALLGDDSNYSGLSAVPGRPTAVDGPKASIASALSAAPDSSLILIVESLYYETNLSLSGKDLTLRPHGNVIFTF